MTFASLFATLLLAAPAGAATITVTTSADDVTPNDGSVSLREAITAINAGSTLGDPDIMNQNPGLFGPLDHVHFNIGGGGQQTIEVGSQAFATGPLPALTKNVILDATTQPGYAGVPLIAIDGSSAGASADGLEASGLLVTQAAIKGFDVFGFSGSQILLNTVSGGSIIANDIGFDAGGAPAHSETGIKVASSSAVTIGGTTAAARNVISGNRADGVLISGAAIQASANIVVGNFIGTDPTGQSADGNARFAPAGTTAAGVHLLDQSNNNTIGGTSAGSRNVISGNGLGGVLIEGGQNNTVQGNFIGTDSSAQPLPNAGYGIKIAGVNATNPGADNMIGGTVSGGGNLIEFNTGPGVVVTDNHAINNEILGNSIDSNGGLGIDLGGDGVTPNTPGGPHAGPNRLQNFPVITSVSPSASSTAIQGTLNGAASTTFRVELFTSPTCDPSGSGQGQTFIGFANPVTNASGDASFSVNLMSTVVAPGTSVTATATDPSNNTSEFSQCVTLPPAQHVLSVSVAGTGTGSVSGSGISCPGSCSHSYVEGTSVTLSANPAGGSTFAGWGGACSGTVACVVTTNSDQTVTATFTATSTPKSKPHLSQLRLHPASFHTTTVASKRKHRHTGTRVSYSDSEVARTTLTVDAIKPGVKSGKHCVARTKRNSHGKHVKRCSRFVTLGHFSHTDGAGNNSFTWGGVLGRRALAHGHYRLDVVASNANGAGNPLQLRFRIV